MRLLRKYYFFPLLLFLSLFSFFSRFIPNQFDSKLTKANELGIRVINEEEFIELLKDLGEN